MKGDTRNKDIRLLIEKIIPGGESLGHHEGKVIFVEGALPGETVLVQVQNSHSRYDRAVLKEVLIPSEDRISPPCPYYAKCGGCNWMHMNYQAQLRFKQAWVQGILQRFAGISIPDLPISPGPQWRYRNRLQFQMNSKGEVGFHGKSSHRVEPVSDCLVAMESVPKAIQEIQDQRDMKSIPLRIPVFLGGKRGCQIHIPGSGTDIQVQILGKKIQFSLNCFFQSNLTLLEELIPFALDGLEGNLFLDLYGGVGIFSAILNSGFEHRILVESNASAICFAKRNLKGLNASIIKKRVEELSRSDIPSVPDAVLVNPPRVGISPKALEFLLLLEPESIRYVSCNPVTQARDLNRLLSKYRLEKIRLFDFYPQTHEVESVVHLRRL